MAHMLSDHNEIIRNRYSKADRMRGEGIAPFVNRWLPTHNSSVIRANQAELIENKTHLRIAGRIMTIRNMGKANFFHLKDDGGTMQVYLKKDDISEEAYRIFKDYTDMGDIVGVEGEAFITKTGELSVHARGFHFLTKSMRPLPEKWHGLTDKETRYRQRYVDLIANEEVKTTFVHRSRIISEFRSYLTCQGYLEVETPMMHPIAGGATARPFITHHNALNMPLFLRIAPELYLKRLVVGGLEKTFEINRNFRNEGLSVRHNPEFTMLELYAAWCDYRDIMALTEDAMRQVAVKVLGKTEFEFNEHKFDVGPEFPRLTYLDAIKRYIPELANADLSWNDSVEETIRKVAPAHKVDTATSTHSILIDLFETRVEPSLIQPVFITEFAKAVSPLSKSRPDNPLVAERFELYICGMEIANGYSELNDPAEQYERFKEQSLAKAAGDDEAQEMDEDYIRALEHGMPPTGGLGIGIDRTVMLYTNSASIRDVILFPLMKPENPQARAESEETASSNV